MTYKNELDWMFTAINLAKTSSIDAPIGSVIVFNDEIVSEAHNEVEQNQNPLDHSELLCIKRACEKLGTKYLNECTLYCTLEPCPMCMYAIKLSKLKRVVFGTFREEDDEFKLDCVGGILQSECKVLLQDFFAKLRIFKEQG